MKEATEAQLDPEQSRGERKRRKHSVVHKINYWQAGRAKAARSHRRRTLRKLHAKGIYLGKLHKCFGFKLAL